MTFNSTFKGGKSAILFFVAIFAFSASVGFVWWQSKHQLDTASLLDTKIKATEKQIAAHPSDIKPYLAASSLYVQKIRETGDASYYSTIDTLLDTALTVDKKNGDIYALRATVENGRHHFREGLALAKKALESKLSADYFGIKADSEIELGAYDAAEQSLQIMVDTKPNYNAFTRIAYLRELTGDFEGAEEALQKAIESGSTYPENTAWTWVELGLLQLRSSPSQAQVSFETSLRIQADYPPALEGMGKVAFASGDQEKAETYFSQAFKVRPFAQHAIDLGDLYTTEHKESLAAQQYTLAEIAFQKSISSGTNVDLEYALFLSDHGDTKKALALARQAHRDRPSIFSADTLAWALYKNNSFMEASSFVKEALRLGENEPLLVFHAAMISEAQGDKREATRLFKQTKDLNPHFSILFSAILKTKTQ